MGLVYTHSCALVEPSYPLPIQCLLEASNNAKDTTVPLGLVLEPIAAAQIPLDGVPGSHPAKKETQVGTDTPVYSRERKTSHGVFGSRTRGVGA